MTEQEAYQEHIRYTHDTYCRIVIRHASFDAARMLAARWRREISLEYLTEESCSTKHHRRVFSSAGLWRNLSVFCPGVRRYF